MELQVDLNTRDASGGADDTREGTVIGGDVLSIENNHYLVENIR